MTAHKPSLGNLANEEPWMREPMFQFTFDGVTLIANRDWLEMELAELRNSGVEEDELPDIVPCTKNSEQIAALPEFEGW